MEVEKQEGLDGWVGDMAVMWGSCAAIADLLVTSSVSVDELVLLWSEGTETSNGVKALLKDPLSSRLSKPFVSSPGEARKESQGLPVLGAEQQGKAEAGWRDLAMLLLGAGCCLQLCLSPGISVSCSPGFA